METVTNKNLKLTKQEQQLQDASMNYFTAKSDEHEQTQLIDLHVTYKQDSSVFVFFSSLTHTHTHTHSHTHTYTHTYSMVCRMFVSLNKPNYPAGNVPSSPSAVHVRMKRKTASSSSSPLPENFTADVS